MYHQEWMLDGRGGRSGGSRCVVLNIILKSVSVGLGMGMDLQVELDKDFSLVRLTNGLFSILTLHRSDQCSQLPIVKKVCQSDWNWCLMQKKFSITTNTLKLFM